MPQNERETEPKFCPACGKRTATDIDSVFLEYGEWAGDAYDEEGDAPAYRCGDPFCRYAFADLDGFGF